MQNWGDGRRVFRLNMEDNKELILPGFPLILRMYSLGCVSMEVH